MTIRNFTIPLSIDPELFDMLEAARGKVSRSAFVRDAIESKITQMAD